jgi:hypothetical protein
MFAYAFVALNLQTRSKNDLVMENRIIYLFTCRTNMEVRGYTTDNSGANLPNDTIDCNSGWQFVSGFEVSEDLDSLLRENTKEIIEAINKNGIL